MSKGDVFISHASKDDSFVANLRQALKTHRIPVWVDSRNLRGGDKLAPEIEQAIEQARQVIVVLSPDTINSPWVQREVRKAQQVERQRRAQANGLGAKLSAWWRGGAGKTPPQNGVGYRIIPLLLSGITEKALGNWFSEEPVAVPIQLKPGGLSEALPQILAALGEQLPSDRQAFQSVNAKPVAELLLKLVDAEILTEEGKRRVTATATVVYEPAGDTAREIESNRFHFTAPLGPIEAEELRWYLERYYLWPTGVFQQRAEHLAADPSLHYRDAAELQLLLERLRA